MSDTNFTICFLSSPFSIVTSVALNVFVNADLTSALHPPHVTPDIVAVYFVSPLARLINPAIINSVSSVFFIFLRKFIGDVPRAAGIKRKVSYHFYLSCGPLPGRRAMKALVSHGKSRHLLARIL